MDSSTKTLSPAQQVSCSLPYSSLQLRSRRPLTRQSKQPQQTKLGFETKSSAKVEFQKVNKDADSLLQKRNRKRKYDVFQQGLSQRSSQQTIQQTVQKSLTAKGKAASKKGNGNLISYFKAQKGPQGTQKSSLDEPCSQGNHVSDKSSSRIVSSSEEGGECEDVEVISLESDLSRQANSSVQITRENKKGQPARLSQPICRSGSMSVLEVNVTESSASQMSDQFSMKRIVFTKADIGRGRNNDEMLLDEEEDDFRQMAIVSKVVKPKPEHPVKTKQEAARDARMQQKLLNPKAPSKLTKTRINQLLQLKPPAEPGKSKRFKFTDFGGSSNKSGHSSARSRSSKSSAKKGKGKKKATIKNENLADFFKLDKPIPEVEDESTPIAKEFIEKSKQATNNIQLKKQQREFEQAKAEQLRQQALDTKQEFKAKCQKHQGFFSKTNSLFVKARDHLVKKTDLKGVSQALVDGLLEAFLTHKQGQSSEQVQQQNDLAQFNPYFTTYGPLLYPIAADVKKEVASFCSSPPSESNRTILVLTGDSRNDTALARMLVLSILKKELGLDIVRLSGGSQKRSINGFKNLLSASQHSSVEKNFVNFFNLSKQKPAKEKKKLLFIEDIDCLFADEFEDPSELILQLIKLGKQSKVPLVVTAADFSELRAHVEGVIEEAQVSIAFKEVKIGSEFNQQQQKALVLIRALEEVFENTFVADLGDLSSPSEENQALAKLKERIEGLLPQVASSAYSSDSVWHQLSQAQILNQKPILEDPELSLVPCICHWHDGNDASDIDDLAEKLALESEMNVTASATLRRISLFTEEEHELEEEAKPQQQLNPLLEFTKPKQEFEEPATAVRDLPAIKQQENLFTGLKHLNQIQLALFNYRASPSEVDLQEFEMNRIDHGAKSMAQQQRTLRATVTNYSMNFSASDCRLLGGFMSDLIQTTSDALKQKRSTKKQSFSKHQIMMKPVFPMVIINKLEAGAMDAYCFADELKNPTKERKQFEQSLRDYLDLLGIA